MIQHYTSQTEHGCTHASFDLSLNPIQLSRELCSMWTVYANVPSPPLGPLRLCNFLLLLNTGTGTSVLHRFLSSLVKFSGRSLPCQTRRYPFAYFKGTSTSTQLILNSSAPYNLPSCIWVNSTFGSPTAVQTQ